MKKDLKSLIQYSKDILDKHGPEAKSPNKHHPILTHDLIMNYNYHVSLRTCMT